MELSEKTVSFTLPEEVRFTIPKALLDTFVREPRIVIKWRPDGLWPIPPELLLETNWMKELISDKDFTENYEVVIMKKG
jgi:hypothetical protein